MSTSDPDNKDKSFTDTGSHSRSRGVVASKEKLEQAMLNAGYKSQAALARAIAEHEGVELDKAPRDMVNKVFRGSRVDTKTIKRIAIVLGVEAYSLYLSSQEHQATLYSEHEQQQVQNSQLDSKRHKRVYPTILFSVLLLSLILVLLFRTSNNNYNPETVKNTTPLASPMALVILAKTPYAEQLAKLLRAQLPSNIKTSIVSAILADNTDMSSDIAVKYGADQVVTVKVTQQGKYLGIQYFQFNGQVERLIWTQTSTTTNLSRSPSQLLQGVPERITTALNATEQDKIDYQAFPSLTAQSDFLKARRLLDNSQQELNIKRAKDLLNNAIEQSPNFANAYAILCQAWTLESWSGNEKQKLVKAKAMCEKALSVDDDNILALTMTAYVMRRTGEVKNSITQYHKVLTLWPENYDASAGLVSSYLEAYRQQLAEFPNALVQAQTYAQQTVEIEPTYWKNHSDLATIEYYMGNIEQAVQAFAKSAELNPNELSFVNLGTMQLCLGNVEQSVDAYQQAYALAPESYLGQEFLGQSYYFLGDFARSEQYRASAIAAMDPSSLGNIHQIQGNMADSYRQTGKVRQAIDNYLTALQIIEKDQINSALSTTDKVYRHYYHAMLYQLDSDKFGLNKQGLLTTLSQYLSLDLDASTALRLALSFIALEQNDQATLALQKVTAKCPGYEVYPDIQMLVNKT